MHQLDEFGRGRFGLGDGFGVVDANTGGLEFFEGASSASVCSLSVKGRPSRWRNLRDSQGRLKSVSKSKAMTWGRGVGAEAGMRNLLRVSGWGGWRSAGRDGGHPLG